MRLRRPETMSRKPSWISIAIAYAPLNRRGRDAATEDAGFNRALRTVRRLGMSNGIELAEYSILKWACLISSISCLDRTINNPK